MATPALINRPLRGSRILFVDDEPVLRKLGQAVFSGHGFLVDLAANGLEALHRLKECIPDLVVSDLRMPKMSGFEFLSIVRRRFPSMPVIAISGEFMSSSEVLGIADAFFAKGSYSPEQLCAKATELLTRPPERRELESPPIWVPVGPSGDIVLTCTECFRSFAVRVCPPEISNSVQHAECLVCGCQLHYRIDKTTLHPEFDFDCRFLQKPRE